MSVIVCVEHTGTTCVFSTFVNGEFTQMWEGLAGPLILEIFLSSPMITRTKALELHLSRDQEESQSLSLALGWLIGKIQEAQGPWYHEELGYCFVSRKVGASLQ